MFLPRHRPPRIHGPSRRDPCVLRRLGLRRLRRGKGLPPKLCDLLGRPILNMWLLNGGDSGVPTVRPRVTARCSNHSIHSKSDRNSLSSFASFAASEPGITRIAVDFWLPPSISNLFLLLCQYRSLDTSKPHPLSPCPPSPPFPPRFGMLRGRGVGRFNFGLQRIGPQLCYLVSEHWNVWLA